MSVVLYAERGGLPSVSKLPMNGRICLFGNSLLMNEGGLEAYGNNVSFYNSRGMVVQATAKTDGAAYIVENLGVGGRDSSRLKLAVEEACNSVADIVVFNEYTNDANSGVAFASVRTNYDYIVS